MTTRNRSHARACNLFLCLYANVPQTLHGTLCTPQPHTLTVSRYNSKQSALSLSAEDAHKGSEPADTRARCKAAFQTWSDLHGQPSSTAEPPAWQTLRARSRPPHLGRPPALVSPAESTRANGQHDLRTVWWCARYQHCAAGCILHLQALPYDCSRQPSNNTA